MPVAVIGHLRSASGLGLQITLSPGWSRFMWVDTQAARTFVLSLARANILRAKSLPTFIIQQIFVECKAPFCRGKFLAVDFLG